MSIELETIQPQTPPRTASPSPDRRALNPLQLGSQQLAPVDSGRDAYLFLAAATLVEAMVWGLPFSVGVLHAYWTTTSFADVDGAESTLTLAATLMVRLMYMLALVFGPLLQRFARQRVYLQAFGMVVAVAGLVGSAFATKPAHLVVTLGILYPFSCLLYLPCATLLFEWFSERRGAASGVLYSGTGLGGTVFPFLMTALLDRFGYKASMIALGLGFGIFSSIALCFIKPRIPVTRSGAVGLTRRKFNGDFLRRSTFWCFGSCIFCISLGNFLPSLFLPQFAQEVGAKPDGAHLISIMNACSVPGLLLLGWLTDKAPLRLVIAGSCLGAALSTAFLWGFAESNAALVVFACVFGLTSLGFTACWTRLITVVSKDDPRLPQLLFSLFTCVRGVGNITSGPIASALLKSTLFQGSTVGAYGRNYGALLVHASATMAAGAVVGVAYRE